MYSITFVNPFDDDIQLEVRHGNNADCPSNEQKYKGTLNAHDSYFLATDQNVVCYRRTADPSIPGNGMTNWNTFSPDDQNTPATITL